MARTPKSRHSEPSKSGSTIDIDPKDVKRIDGTTPAPEEGVGDITSKESIAPVDAAKDAKPADAKPEAVKAAALVEKASQATPVDADKAKPDLKPENKSEPVKPAAVKADEKPKPAASSTPSAFATKSAVGTPPPSARQQQRGGSTLMGGVIGGLIVLALGAGLQAAGMWPGTGNTEDERVAALQTEMDSLRGDINQLRTASGDDTATVERLDALEAAIADVSNAPDASAALAEVEQRLASADDASSDNASRLTGIEEGLAGVEESLAGFEQGLADLETRLAAVEETSQSEHITAASALKSAIDRGQSFTAELDAYANLGGEGSEVDDLRAYAEGGIPTRAEINGEAEAAARAMIAAGSSVDANAGFIDRLSASARSLVQVRPVGMAEGEDVAATVARFETSVRQDDYARAILEYESLPEEAQAAGADFMEKVRARNAADQLIDEALSAALQDS